MTASCDFLHGDFHDQSISTRFTVTSVRYKQGVGNTQYAISLYEISKSRDFNCDFVISTVIS